jgi:large subunit ribosomal protein L35
MPKQKTNRAAAKRFRLKKNGRVKFRRANRNHILTKKSQSTKRRLRVEGGHLSAADTPLVKRMLRKERAA